MPLLVPIVITPPPPVLEPPPTPPPGPETGPIPLPPDPNACVISPGVLGLTDADGRTWIIDGSEGIWEKPGRRGFHSPTYNFHEDESPALDGALIRAVRAQVTELFVPLVFAQPTEQQLRTLRRSFIKSTSPKRGMCVLSLGFLDGTRRHINVWRGQGMEGEEGPGSLGVRFMRYGLSLRALDPFWYGDDIHAFTWQGTGSQAFFPLPHSPTNFINLLPGQVFGDATIVNPGDVESFPRWTITGPASSFTAVNSTTGKTLTLSCSLASSAAHRFIDTRPGIVSITDDAGANKWTELATGSALWSLAEGTNVINVTLGGSNAQSKVDLTYQPRYEGS